MIILLAVAAVLVAAPIIAALLVSMASLREDARHSLGGKAPSWVARAARRLLRVQPRGVGLRRIPRVPRPRVAGGRLPEDEDEDLAGRPAGPQA